MAKHATPNGVELFSKTIRKHGAEATVRMIPNVSFVSEMVVRWQIATCQVTIHERSKDYGTNRRLSCLARVVENS